MIIIADLVLPAISLSIFSMLIFLGGVITKLSPFHSTFTPILSKTSDTLYTSSIFGALIIVVVPLFKREAAITPIVPFFDERTFIFPESL